MQKKVVLLFFTLLFATSLSVPGLGQDFTSENRADWFKEAKFGMFIHWGLYSQLAGSYNGHTLPDPGFPQGRSWYAEWIKPRLEVPDDVYRALVDTFNPVKFDADSWIREAKEAGMKYFVITAKHHDGFALWDSKVSDYDIGNTPFKRDILGELATACKKYGLKYGFYYSHNQDWDHPGGATPFWTAQKTDAQFETYWHEKSLPQVKELIERYQPDLFWFDTWGDEQEKIFISNERRDELIHLIRTLSPKTIINGRISWHNPGNEIDFLEMMDNQYPTELQKRPWQTPATMVHSWGWHAKDYNWKTAKEMIGYLVSNTAKGGNYLLNVGPKPDGTFPPMAIRRLREMGGWMQANGDAIYGAKPVNWTTSSSLALTQKAIEGKKIIYVSIIKPLNTTQLHLPIATHTIKNCELLDSGMPLKLESNGFGTTIYLTEKIAGLQDGVPVIALEIKE